MDLAELDKMLIEAGIDPERDTSLDGDLDRHVWSPIQLSHFADDPYEWKCSKCGRTLTIKKKYPPEPPEPDYDNITDDDEMEKADKAYSDAMDAYEATKNSLASMETLGEAMEREGVKESCAAEVQADVHNR